MLFLLLWVLNDGELTAGQRDHIGRPVAELFECGNLIDASGEEVTFTWGYGRRVWSIPRRACNVTV